MLGIGFDFHQVAEDSGAEVNVARECILGTKDRPVSITGTTDQVVLATMHINAVVKGLADSGALSAIDFAFIALPEHDARCADPAIFSGSSQHGLQELPGRTANALEGSDMLAGPSAAEVDVAGLRDNFNGDPSIAGAVRCSIAAVDNALSAETHSPALFAVTRGRFIKHT